MKLVVAIIQPDRLEAVKSALAEVEVYRITISDMKGFGQHKSAPEYYRGHEVSINLMRMLQVMIAVNDDFLEPTIEAIKKGGKTGEEGQIGDGKILVLPLEDCIRIRTGEHGSEAI